MRSLGPFWILLLVNIEQQKEHSISPVIINAGITWPVIAKFGQGLAGVAGPVAKKRGGGVAHSPSQRKTQMGFETLVPSTHCGCQKKGLRVSPYCRPSPLASPGIALNRPLHSGQTCLVLGVSCETAGRTVVGPTDESGPISIHLEEPSMKGWWSVGDYITAGIIFTVVECVLLFFLPLWG